MTIEASPLVRHASNDDISGIKHITDLHRNEVGFVMRPALELACSKRWLLVAEVQSVIVGFCNYRHCQRPAGKTTIYEIAVLEPRIGVGSVLLNELIAEAQRKQQSYIYLKCVEGLTANWFYASHGFSLVGLDTGKKRHLNVWRLDIGESPWT